ncbi:MAG: proton-conducting transporter membrane subunit, partial [Clostridiaceae bacterium]
MEINILIILPLIGAILSALFIKKRKIVLTLFIAISLALTYILYTLYGRWDLTVNYPVNISYLGGNITIGFKVNPLGWFFSFFSMTITFLIALFSFSYNDNKHDSKTVPLWLILLMASSGIFLANDFLMLFVMWEIMGVSSYFIIAHGKKLSEKAARFYMSLSLVGTSTMLFGIMLLGNAAKSFDLGTGINYLIGSAGKNSLSLLILALFLITFLIKSAIFPFYMWPSRAYAEAPDDFTPFLSTVMSKYGIYGLALFILPVIQNAGFSQMGKINQPAYLLAILGAITGVLGTVLAIFETDIKKLFAYSSVSNIGYIVMGLSTMSLTGAQGALFHSVNHMVFKTAIFLSLAAVIYRTGERDMHKLGGLVY